MGKVVCATADRAYDTNEIRDHLAEDNAKCVIPSKCNRLVQIPHSKYLYGAPRVNPWFLALRTQGATSRRSQKQTCHLHQRLKAWSSAEADKKRHGGENFFRKEQDFRRVATRYDKLGCVFLAFVQIASTFIFLRDFVNTP